MGVESLPLVSVEDDEDSDDELELDESLDDEDELLDRFFLPLPRFFFFFFSFFSVKFNSCFSVSFISYDLAPVNPGSNSSAGSIKGFVVDVLLFKKSREFCASSWKGIIAKQSSYAFCASVILFSSS